MISYESTSQDKLECEPGTWAALLSRSNCVQYDMDGKPYIDALIPVFINFDIPPGTIRCGDKFEITGLDFVTI